jgi:SAM-dependent methyltransferase
LVLEGMVIRATARVYELSSRGALVRYLRQRFSDLTLSEYFDDVPAGGWRRGVQCQDVERLTYADRSFDLVTSTEVFEHVAADRRGFSEVARVLAPGGHFVFTVPFSGRHETVERARMQNGAIEQLLPAAYHGDRLRGRGRVFVFRDYGSDIVDRLAASGLEAELRTVDRPELGIAPPGHVVVARRRLD